MSARPLQVIVLGPPGAGKGTQASRLAIRFGLVHINPGHILRHEFAADPDAAKQIRSAMAAGELVPDELVDVVVRDRLGQLSPDEGFVLDGYPRTAAEAQALRGMLADLDRLRQRPTVVWLDVGRDELLRRLRRRRELEGRADDNDHAILKRIEVHEANAHRLLEELQSWTEVKRIDGRPQPDAVTAQIVDILSTKVSGPRMSGSASRDVGPSPDAGHAGL